MQSFDSCLYQHGPNWMGDELRLALDSDHRRPSDRLMGIASNCFILD